MIYFISMIKVIQYPEYLRLSTLLPYYLTHLLYVLRLEILLLLLVLLPIGIIIRETGRARYDMI